MKILAAEVFYGIRHRFGIKNRNQAEARRYMHEHLEDILCKVKIDNERKARLGEAQKEERKE